MQPSSASPTASPAAFSVSGTTSAFSCAPNTRLTPSIASISPRLSSALQPVTTTKAPGFILWTRRTRFRDFLSETAVTLQVFTRYMSAFSLQGTTSSPAALKPRS